MNTSQWIQRKNSIPGTGMLLYILWMSGCAFSGEDVADSNNDCEGTACLDNAVFDGTIDIEIQPSSESTLLAQQFFDVHGVQNGFDRQNDSGETVLDIRETRSVDLSIISELGEGIPSRIIYEPTEFIASRRLVRNLETDERGMFTLSRPEGEQARLWIVPEDSEGRLPFSYPLSGVTTGTQIVEPEIDAQLFFGTVVWREELLSGPDRAAEEGYDEPADQGADDGQSGEENTDGDPDPDPDRDIDSDIDNGSEDETPNVDLVPDENLFEGLRVWLERNGRRISTSVRPDASGRFQLLTLLNDAESDDFFEMVVQTPSVSEMEGARLEFRFSLVLDTDLRSADLGNFRVGLEERTSEVSFQVLDADGEVAPEAHIVVRSRTHAFETYRLITDTSGLAAVELPEGSYEVIAEGKANQRTAGRSTLEQFDVTDEDVVFDIELRERLQSRIVLVSEETPIEAELVLVSLPESGVPNEIAISSRFTELTDSEGMLNVYLNPGLHRLIAVPNPVFGLSTHFTNIDISEDSVSDEGDIVVQNINMPEARLMRVVLQHEQSSEGSLVRIYARQTLFGEPILLGEALADVAGVAEVIVPENR